MKVAHLNWGIGLGALLLAGLLDGCTRSHVDEPLADPVQERGRYLAEHVVNCQHCHTGQRDKAVWGEPPVAPFYGGQDCPVRDRNPAAKDRPDARMSKLCTANISSDTKTGIGSWSKTDIINAFREGIARDGRPLFPIMWLNLHAISDEDADAIASYIQTVEPIVNEQPGRSQAISQKLHDFVLNNLPPSPESAPSLDDEVTYGGYLAQIARCKFCHTPRDGPGRSQPEKAWTGGARYPDGAGGYTYSTNITTHEEGIGDLPRSDFIALFRTRGGRIPAGETNTVMPWVAFAGMTDEDLGAIWAMLQTLEPKPRSMSPKYVF
jgi:mono/diheme cytochrome c family protein